MLDLLTVLLFVEGSEQRVQLQVLLLKGFDLVLGLQESVAGRLDLFQESGALFTLIV